MVAPSRSEYGPPMLAVGARFAAGRSASSGWHAMKSSSPAPATIRTRDEVMAPRLLTQGSCCNSVANRSTLFLMRMRRLLPGLAAAFGCACGGVTPMSGGTGPGQPADVVQVRLFDPHGTELTLHTGLVDNDSLAVEGRLYAPDWHRLTDIAGGVEFDLPFMPDWPATSPPIPGTPLEPLVHPPATSGSAGTPTLPLHF